MNNKKIITILIIVILITFSVGLLSFNYNDKDKFTGIMDNGIVNIQSGEEVVNIGTNGIEINDGDDHVSIGWNGINISDGNEHVSIGWNGINVREGGKTKFKFGNQRNFFSFRSPKLISYSIDEEKFVDIDNISNISVSSSFVNIKVASEDRDDIRIHYHGNLTSNVQPKLKIDKGSNNIDIKLETSGSSQVTTRSDVVLEVLVPKSYRGNFNSVTSSGKIEMENLVGENFNISSSSGKLDLSDLKGSNFNVSTSSGKVELEESIGKFNIATSSGAVDLDNTKNSEDIKISTSSGSVEIKLHEDANYSIKGSSSSGRYTSNIDMDIIENEKGRFMGKIGSGHKSIDIRTSSGIVKFR